jgi:hypothetical protein
MTAVTANARVRDIPAVPTSPEAAKATNPKTRWTKRGSGKPVADQLTVFNATELKRARKTQMKDEPKTDQVRYPEHEETNMPTDATDNIGKTTTAREKASNMPSGPKKENKHLAIRSGEEGQSSDPMPPAVLHHGSFVDSWLLPGGESIVSLFWENGSLLLERRGVPENTVQSRVPISPLGWRPGHFALVDGLLWQINAADFVMREFSCVDGAHRATHSFGHLLSSSETLLEVRVLLGTRRTLLTTMDSSGLKRRVECRTRIIDMDEERVIVESGGVCLCEVIPGARPAKIFRYGSRGDEGIYGADGSLVTRLHLPKGRIWPLVAGPKGEGFQGITGGYDNPGPVAELVLLDDRGEVKARMPLPDGEVLDEMIALPAALRTLVRTQNIDTRIMRLWSYVYGDHGYRLEGKRILPLNVTMMQDQDATSAVFSVSQKVGGRQLRRVDPIDGVLGLFSDEEWS